jgi:hypothetical protein
MEATVWDVEADVAPLFRYTTKTQLAAAQGAKLTSSAIQAAGGISITAGAMAGVLTGTSFALSSLKSVLAMARDLHALCGGAELTYLP